MKIIILFFCLCFLITLQAQTDTVKYQWPVTPLNSSHGINGTFAEFRNTGSSDHFHNAVDIGEPDGNPVYSGIDGIVYSIVNSIGSNNYVSVKTQIGSKWKRLTYLHISPNPNLYVGQNVSKGVDVIGYIYSGMGHVHLIERELVSDVNNYAVEINNLREGGGVTPYFDTYPPIIHSNTLKFRLNGTEFNLPPDGLSNKLDIIIKIEEQNGTSSIHKNNGTYIIGYRIWSADTSTIAYEPPDSGVRYKFFRKPYNSDVHNVFLAGTATLSNPVYIITNGKGAQYINGNRSVGNNYFDTGLLDEGDYVLEIFSEDTRRNRVQKFFPISITRNDVVPPGRPELLAVENFNNRKSVRVIYSQNKEPDIAGYRLYYTGNTLLQNWKLAADENMLTNNNDSYEFESPAEFINPSDGEVYFFYLTAVDSAGNESEGSDIYSRSSFTNGNSYPKILIVDGFDRYGGSGSWGSPVHSFNTKYFIALTILDSSVVSSCANEAVSGGNVKLDNYDMVLWFCGDESTENNTFTSEEQNKVIEYLESGGNIFVTGSEIGWDLDRTHQYSEAADSLFYRHYLKAEFVYDGNNSMTRAAGVNGTAFEGLSLSFGESYKEDWPDDIDANDGSAVILNYNQTREDLTTKRNAGVAYKGTFGNSSNTGAVVYVSYAVESMGSVSQIVELLGRSVDFFGLVSSVNENSQKPDAYRLFNNYPNPFNPTTEISFYIPEASEVKFEIYNSLGQRIDILINRKLTAGEYKLRWNAGEYSSDVYFGRLTAGKFMRTIKMSLVK